MSKISIAFSAILILFLTTASCSRDYPRSDESIIPPDSVSEAYSQEDEIFKETGNVTIESDMIIFSPESTVIDNVTVEGKEYTLYLYDDPNYDPSNLNSHVKPIFPAVILTNSNPQSTSPTLVREGDTFLDWKAVDVDTSYIYYDDGRMYPWYYGGVIVQFEGEITVKATIKYYQDDYSGESLYIIPDDEYQQLFPILYNAGKEYETGFSAYNGDEVLDILEHKYGEYECEITVRDYHLIRVPMERFCMATITDITVLSEKDKETEIEFLESYPYEGDFDFEEFTLQYAEQLVLKDFTPLYTDSFEDGKIRTVSVYADEYIHYIFVNLPSESTVISARIKMDIEEFRRIELSSLIDDIVSCAKLH